MSYRKIGIIGDVHCENELLEKAISHLIDRKPDIIICTGDIADGTGDFDKCVSLLKYHEIKTIRGNHDSWLIGNSMRSLPNSTRLESVKTSSVEYLKQLPKTMSFETPLGEALLCHGLGENDMARLTPDDYGYAIEANSDLQKLISENRYLVIISGHTHRIMVRNLENRLFINAGTLIKAHAPCFSLADFSLRKIKFQFFDKNGVASRKETIAFT